MSIRIVFFLLQMIHNLQLKCNAQPNFMTSPGIASMNQIENNSVGQESLNVSKEHEINHNEMKNIDTSLSWAIIGCQIFLFLVSPLLAGILLSFLRNQPLTKQCTMTYLYQDLIKGHLGFIWVWSSSGIIMKILLPMANDVWIKQFVSYLALISQALFVLVFLYICLIGALRLYSAMVNRLDPLEEIIGGNDDKAILIARSIIWIVVALIVFLYWYCSTNPIVYYQICDQKDTLAELPTKSLILFLCDMTLCIFSILLHVMVKLYQNIDDAKTRNELLELDKHLSNQFRNTKRTSIEVDDFNYAQTQTPHPFSVHRSTIPLVLCISNSIVVELLLILRYFAVSNINFWWVMVVFTGNQGVIFPLLFIMMYQEVRIYSLRRLQYYWDALTNKILIVRDRYQRRNLRRVIPLNIEKGERNSMTLDNVDKS